MSDPINLLTLAKMSEAEARALLERLRWPDGPICPHCGVVGEATRIESREGTKGRARLRDGVWNCRACREPFTATVGTIFEGSHVPLSKWLIGFYLFASSKKSLSALQLKRQLGIGSYRTAWFMAHRIRFAMQNDPTPPKLTGDVEVDETYVGGKPRPLGKAMREAIARGEVPAPPKPKRGRGTSKACVQVLVSRDGPTRARVVIDATAETLNPYIKAHVAKTAAIHSDEHPPYRALAAHFEGGHHTVNHTEHEYARGNVMTNTAESFNGLFKRCIVGAWHNISREHLQRYLDEASFRFSHRETTDTERTVAALGRVDGVRLMYRKPRRQGQQGYKGLVDRTEDAPEARGMGT